MKKILAKYKIYNIIIKIITKQLSHTSFLHGRKAMKGKIEINMPKMCHILSILLTIEVLKLI